jgi:thiol-disulfide isomerase/thioredoxin
MAPPAADRAGLRARPRRLYNVPVTPIVRARTRAGTLLLGPALLGALLAPACRTQPAGIRWSRSLAEAAAEASGERLIVVDLYTDWCGWCKEMDRTTWADPTVIALGDRHVFLKLNAERDPDGVALQKKFAVGSYPTVLLLDAKGEEFERMEGYLPAPRFLDRLRSTIADPAALGNLRLREPREPENLELRYQLGKKLMARNAVAGARERFEVIVARDPANRTRLTDGALFYLAACQAGQRQSDRALESLDQLRRRHPDSRFAPRASLLEGELLLRAGRRNAARARLKEFLKRWPEHELAADARDLLDET